MQNRLFSTKNNLKKTQFDTSVEWHKELTPALEKQIIATHLSSFIDLYKNHSEADLGTLKPGITKKAWLTKMIEDEIKDIKEGKVFIATVSVMDSIAGFITCTPVKRRDENLSRKHSNSDVYISLLAVKPFHYLMKYGPSNELKVLQAKAHIGLGRQLVESVAARFPDADTITLDTRKINEDGKKFYKSLGFDPSEKTFGGSAAEYYLGYEKEVPRSAMTI
jgi:hypothetical protein